MLLLNNWRSRAGFTAMLCAIGAFLFLPIIWMVLTSIKPEGEVFVRIPSIFPHAPTLENYRALFGNRETLAQLRNSLITAGGGALLTVMLSTYAAYSFAKFRYFGRKPLMFMMLSAQMFPFAMLLISVYPMLQWANLLNTRVGLIIAYIILALPSGTYMLYSYFISIPSEIIEAARVDGASEIYILHRIVTPLAIPAMVTVGLYSFMWAWNDLLFSLTLITSPELRTVGPGLLLSYLGEGRANWGGAMAESIVISLPVVLGFAFLQRYFIKGLTAGAVKS
jgi:multiple sugar transport system permease protein